MLQAHCSNCCQMHIEHTRHEILSYFKLFFLQSIYILIMDVYTSHIF